MKSGREILLSFVNAVTREPKGVKNTNASQVHITPEQFYRLRADINSLKTARGEAERVFFPHRVALQRIYVDVRDNDHVTTCIETRKDLTLLRDYELVNEENVADKDWTEFFKNPCFHLLNFYALDGVFNGYCLIRLGDIVNNLFPKLGFVPYENVSPDRMHITTRIYMATGQSFLEEPYKNWYIWCTTPSENGKSPCGYGLLNKIAALEILMRGNLGRNADFNELFGSPLRIAKTDKDNEEERAQFLQDVYDMAHQGAILLDNGDTIDFKEVMSPGTGYQTYHNLEQRLQNAITKLTLGHEDALKSVPGKLGATQGEESPAEKALLRKQAVDGRYIENIWNGQVIPNLRSLGFPIPLGLKFRFRNDDEKHRDRLRTDAANKTSAEIMLTIKQAGGVPDWQQFTEITGLKVTEAPIIPPPALPAESKDLSAKMRNIISKLYERHNH